VQKKNERRSVAERIALSRIVRGHHLLERLANNPNTNASIGNAMMRILGELNSLTDTLARYQEDRAASVITVQANGEKSSVLP
jgi:hypothetical protein